MRTRRPVSSSSDPVSSTRHREPKVAQPHGHVPVLLHEVLDALEITPDDIVLDATLGGAGHSKEIVRRLGPKGVFIGIDADEAAIGRARDALCDVAPTIHLHQANFRSIPVVLEKCGATHITKALFDLGWSSYQLESGRGFSFLTDEPLVMTYDSTPGPEVLTAEKLVNTWAEESIADVLYGWGNERYARRIARAIIRARDQSRITTSGQLADIVKNAVPGFYAHGKIHPATRTFQALRIAVNDEFGALKDGLAGAWKYLGGASEKGGVRRLAVITFHSQEDREVKQLVKEWEQEGTGVKLTKKPIAPTDEEVRSNPRSRSAKLRAVERTLNTYEAEN